MKPKIYLGCDHAGYALKQKIKVFLLRQGYTVEDIGTDSTESVDYPDFAFAVCEQVVKSSRHRGILICGTGTGMVIAANKVKGIRASFCYDLYSAKKAREDNNSNVLCLRGRQSSALPTLRIVKTWLETPFSNERRHKRRLSKIADHD